MHSAHVYFTINTPLVFYRAPGEVSWRSPWPTKHAAAAADDAVASGIVDIDNVNVVTKTVFQDRVNSIANESGSGGVCGGNDDNGDVDGGGSGGNGVDGGGGGDGGLGRPGWHIECSAMTFAAYGATAGALDLHTGGT
jgi:hypothetical protein